MQRRLRCWIGLSEVWHPQCVSRSLLLNLLTLLLLRSLLSALAGCSVRCPVVLTALDLRVQAPSQWSWDKCKAGNRLVRMVTLGSLATGAQCISVSPVTLAQVLGTGKPRAPVITAINPGTICSVAQS